MSPPSPEEFAASVKACHKVVFSVPSDGPIQHGCEAHGYWWPCPYSRDTTTAIAARDEAVRADAVTTATDADLVGELVRRGVLTEEWRCLCGWDERHRNHDGECRYVTAWEEVGRDE